MHLSFDCEKHEMPAVVVVELRSCAYHVVAEAVLVPARPRANRHEALKRNLVGRCCVAGVHGVVIVHLFFHYAGDQETSLIVSKEQRNNNMAEPRASKLHP